MITVLSVGAYAQASTYLIAAATVVLALAFVAHVAEWALARGSDEEPTSAAMAAGIGRSVTVLAWLILVAGVAWMLFRTAVTPTKA